MFFQTLLERIVKRWLVIIIALIIAFLSIFGYQKTQVNVVDTNMYTASITVGITLNNITEQDVFLANNYDNILTVFSKYLANRFASVDVQSKIANKMDLTMTSFDPKIPFYQINSQDGGFVNLTYSNSDKEKSQKFLKTIKEVYQEIVNTERNLNESRPFKVEPQTTFVENLFEYKPSVQTIAFSYLPFFGIMFTVLVILALLPLHKERKILKENNKKESKNITTDVVSNKITDLNKQQTSIKKKTTK